MGDTDLVGAPMACNFVQSGKLVSECMGGAACLGGSVGRNWEIRGHKTAGQGRLRGPRGFLSSCALMSL